MKFERGYWGLGLLLAFGVVARLPHPLRFSGSRTVASEAPAKPDIDSQEPDLEESTEPSSGEDRTDIVRGGEVPENFQKITESFAMSILGMPADAPPAQVIAPDAKGLVTRATDPLFGRRPKAVTKGRGGGTPPVKRSDAEMEKLRRSETKRFEDWGLKLRDYMQAFITNEKIPKASRLITMRLYFERIVHVWRSYLLLAKIGPDMARPLDDWQLDVPLDLVPEKSPEESFLREMSAGEIPATGIYLAPAALKERALGGTRRSSFDLSLTLVRDVSSYMKVVNQENYTQALKLLSLSMALDQVQLYNAHVGYPRETPLPQQCSDELRELPLKLPAITPTKEERYQAIDGILQNAGLALAGNELYKDYWLNDVQADPSSGGFSGMLPFEKLRAAQRGLEWKASSGMPEPSIDDFESFQQAFAMKAGRALGALSDDDKALVKSMTTLTESGNTSEWIQKELEKTGKESWVDLIPARDRRFLEQVTLRLELPPLDGPDTWRRWGLRELYFWTQRAAAKPSTPGLAYDIAVLCSEFHGKCPPLKEHLVELQKLLVPFGDPNDVLPKVQFEEPALRKEFPYLTRLWTLLRNHRQLVKIQDGKEVEVAVISGWEMLKQQIQNAPPNPWALLKVALTVEVARAGKGSPWPRLRDELRLTGAVQARHANMLLDRNEKRTLWQQTVNEWNDGTTQVLAKQRMAPEEKSTFLDTFHIFKQKPVIDDKRTGWDRLEGISNRSILTRADLDKAIADFSLTGNGNNGILAKEINEAWASPDARAGEFVYRIYQSQGDVDEQQRLLLSEGPEHNFLSEGSVKESILALDLLAKMPLYRRVVVEGSVRSRLDADQVVSRLCSLDWKKDNEEFKKLVFSTMTVQKSLNEKFGLPKPPKEFQEALDKWFKEDTQQLVMGLTQGALAVGSMIALGISCVPPLFCAPAILLGVASVAIGVPMTKIALDDVAKADERENFARTFEGQGLTDAEGVNRFRNNAYGYLETAFNAVSTLPMLGVPVRATSIGTAQVKATVAALVRGAKYADVKVASEAARAMVNVSVARGWLSPSGVREQLNSLGKTLPAKARDAWATTKSAAGRLSALGAARDLSSLESIVKSSLAEILRDGTTKVLVKEEVAQINALFGAKVAAEFGDDAAEMSKFFRGYLPGKAKLSAYETKLQALAAKTAKPQDERWIRRMWRRARLEEWRQNRIMKRLKRGQSYEQITQALDGVRPGELGKFISEHAEVFGDAFQELPLRLRARALPFYVLGQGMPGLIKMPGVRWLARGAMLKEFSAARDILLYEKAKQSALMAFGRSGLDSLGAVRPERSTFQQANFGRIYSDFRETVLSRTKDGAALGRFEEELSKRIWDWQRQNLPQSGRYTQGLMREALFEPQSAEQLALGEAIWGRVPKQVVFGSDPVVKRAAESLIEQLKDYKNFDDFEDYFAALRTLVSMKLPQEIMN